MTGPDRRLFLLGAAAALVPVGAQAAPSHPSVLAFAAYRNGRLIGEHRMTFEHAGEAVAVRTEAEMAVRAGPVTIYRYRHQATERWRDGRFERLDTYTHAGGKRTRVAALRSASSVQITVNAGRPVAAPPEAIPFTHWNLGSISAPLFNPQTGAILRQSARQVGAGYVLSADGRRLKARRVAFTGETQIDNWYDDANVWTGLIGKLEDGSTMEYRRL